MAFRFEDLKVFQTAKEKYSLVSQMKRRLIQWSQILQKVLQDNLYQNLKDS